MTVRMPIFEPAPTAAPGESPWAKGNAACRAADYIQYDEAVKGVEYLEKRFPLWDGKEGRPSVDER